MSTKWILALILLLAVASTVSSAAALVLVLKEQGDVRQLKEKVDSLETALASSAKPVQQQGVETEELTATINLIFQRLNAHEESLDQSVRDLSDRLNPRSPNN